ncbi:MAG: SPOR domain-containing protein [Gemmatimonadota bacterium]
MRLLTVLTLAALVPIAGCGDDEPPPDAGTPAGQPAEQAAPAGADTGQADATPPGAGPAAAPDSPAAATDSPAGAAGAAGAATTAAGEPSLYTVQVAAFADAETAREWAERLGARDLPVWTSTAEVRGRTFHRLRVGALPALTDARRLGRLVTERYAWPVWVAPLTATDDLPVTVEDTRELLERW